LRCMHPFSTSLPRACRMWYIPAEALVTSTAVRKPFRAVDAVTGTVSVPYGNLCCDVSFGRYKYRTAACAVMSLSAVVSTVRQLVL